MDLIFASHNENKVFEIANLVGNKYKILSLNDINFKEDIIENGSTLQENALIKARTIFSETGKNCFADDTGLLVKSLNNEPGVYSARYAGEQKNADDNMNLLLLNLNNKTDRQAKFTTVITLIINGKEFIFEGELAGSIILEKKGSNGFGYDPIFKPNGYINTLAQLDITEKNKISHRALAFKKMNDFLKVYK
ncbi:MAG: RdgB/HAM1 family non-canonical purine NTP pyrophosphatase [Bacteroidota bacterium]|jgi:XTP/dITP diphosphohydrolase